MADISRREFVRGVAVSGVAASLASGTPTEAAAQRGTTIVESMIIVPLVGEWQFATDPEDIGETRRWHLDEGSGDWSSVTVPHTWQIYPQTAQYFGSAWYRRQFHVPETWAGRNLRIEFEAVYHSAQVWVNGWFAGKHERKGYTAFTLDITSAMRPGTNTVVVKVNNRFDSGMLPRERSYDWCPDGGITRPVRLLLAPRVFIEDIAVDAQPNLAEQSAHVSAVISVRNTSEAVVRVTVQCDVVEEGTGKIVASQKSSAATLIEPTGSADIKMPLAVVANPKLWHFDHPHLYQLVARINTGGAIHEHAATFGIRSFQAKDGGFYLNGERVRLMGVERMAGSHPSYGMAEPSSWILHDHEDMRTLNCVFTRVHWPQDRRVLDYCDQHGILVQEEVPAWGPSTFSDQKAEPAPALMQNGLEQLREMVQRNRNHPCIFAWGLCNEIDGQHPAAYRFAERMYEEAHLLDPKRLRAYASNSLHSDPARDVSRLMDFVSWNEYYETWLGGNVEAIKPALEKIRAAFPDKPIVISEYGYCECEKDRTGGDAARIRILREHDEVFRQESHVAGAIFFCYNDYRTHVGDKGIGVMQQRVHGVVDVYGARKPSFDALRQECSPIERFEISRDGDVLMAQIQTRKSLPSYTLMGWKLRWVVYISPDLPMEQRELALPRLAPGEKLSVPIRFEQASAKRLRAEILRPSGFSVATLTEELG